LFWTVLLQSDLLICDYFLGNRKTGVYSVAVSLGVPVTLVAGVVGTWVFQRTSAEHDRSVRTANTNLVSRLMITLALAMLIPLALICRPLIVLLYGNAFAGAAPALVLLTPGLFFLSAQLVLMTHLSGEGSPPVVFLAPLAGAVFNVTANWAVVPRYGIRGASMTSSAGYLIVYAIVLAYYLRRTGSRPSDVLLLKWSDIAMLVGKSAGKERDLHHTG
jgi:O-antigen/teichoic acid export membrane protein